MRKRVAALILASALVACSDKDPTGPVTPPPPVPPVPPTDTAAPPVVREMRGLWIATVGNIDWPTRNTLTAEQQRAELIDILDRAAALGVNAIMFHVRPAADAVYESSLEPWASLLTNVQGRSPGYDPLAFAIEQAHARGMELHAWVNPFRAGNTVDTTRLAANHVFRTQRDLVRVYASNIWLDPGEPAVHDHSMRVITDIVRRYDIDAIHADDYFYPYPVTGVTFQDTSAFRRFGAGLSLADWRRANIDRFVERMYREVHAIKPTLKVGISPFGIWRPGNPPGVAGLDAFASIYADSRKWLQQGWVDYLAPQLYWAISAPQQPFGNLFDWWVAQNTQARHVWPGLAVYKVADRSFTASEIQDQIRLLRTRTTGTGHILYNTNTTLKRSETSAMRDELDTSLYRDAALVPAMPWLDAAPPPAPTIALSGSSIQITPGAGEAARWWAVRLQAGSTWTTRILFGAERSLTIDGSTTRVIVQAVDQAGNLSVAVQLRR